MAVETSVGTINAHILKARDDTRVVTKETTTKDREDKEAFRINSEIKGTKECNSKVDSNSNIRTSKEDRTKIGTKPRIRIETEITITMVVVAKPGKHLM